MSSEQFNHEVDIETLAYTKMCWRRWCKRWWSSTDLEDNVSLKMCWRRWRKRWRSRTDLEDNVLLSSYLERASKNVIERHRATTVELAEAESFVKSHTTPAQSSIEQRMNTAIKLVDTEKFVNFQGQHNHSEEVLSDDN